MTIDHYEISIIKPKASANICANPSFELGTSGWATLGTNTIARSSVQQRRGMYSCKATYQDNDGLLALTVVLTNTPHTASMDIFIPSDYNGTLLNLDFVNYVGGTFVSGLPDMTIRDRWQRIHCHITPAAGDLTGSLYLSENGVNATAGKFIYIDGVLIEADDEPTTYFDGDSEGSLDDEAVEYFWDGLRHNSTSYRTAITFSGGEIIPFNNYCTRLTVLGLGNAPTQNLAIPLVDGSERYLYSKSLARFFTVRVVFQSEAIDLMDAKRKALSDLLDPDPGGYPQLLMLSFVGHSVSNAEVTKRAYVRCSYVSGLEQSPQTNEGYQTDIIFRMYDVTMEMDGDEVVSLSTDYAMIIQCIIVRDHDGLWKDPGAALAAASEDIFDIRENPVDGGVYFVGNYIDMASITNLNYLSRFRGIQATPKFETPLTGASPNGIVRAICFDAAGNIYVGGDFTSIGGSARNYYAKINADGTINSTVWSMAAAVQTTFYDKDGYFWAGTASGLYRTNSGTWTKDTAFPTTSVGFIKQGTDGYLYVVDITNAKLYRGSYGSWTAICTVTGAGSDRVWDFEWDEKGNLIIVGKFTAVNGVSALNIARWDGVTWYKVASIGLGYNSSEYAQKIAKVDAGFLIAGPFTYANNVWARSLILYHGNDNFTYWDFEQSASYSTLNQVFLDSRKRIWYGGGDPVSGWRAYQNIVSNGGDKTYPIITFVGMGNLYHLSNETTGRRIFFNKILLQTGEVAVLDLRPDKLTFVSNLRGDISNYIVPGSNLDFPLIAGDNRIFLLAPSLPNVFLQYKESYRKLDGWLP